mgnify:FL=1
MENSQRPPQKMLNLGTGSWSWNLPDFHGQRANIIKNHKVKNTPSILISFKMIQKLQKNQKSENFVFSGDFRGRWARRLGIYQFFQNAYLRVTDVTNTKKVRDFSWGDRVFLLVGTWKTHFCVFLTLMQFCFEKTLKKHRNSIKNMECVRIEGKISW